MALVFQTSTLSGTRQTSLLKWRCPFKCYNLELHCRSILLRCRNVCRIANLLFVSSSRAKQGSVQVQVCVWVLPHCGVRGGLRVSVEIRLVACSTRYVLTKFMYYDTCFTILLLVFSSFSSSSYEMLRRMFTDSPLSWL